MSHLSLSLINTYYIYLILWLTPVMSRILVMINFSINSISYQYMSMLDLPCGKNTNNDIWNTLRSSATMVYYLCTCRSFFIHIYIFFLVTWNNKELLRVILIVMSGSTNKYIYVDTVFCTCQNDQSGLIGRRRVTVYADSRENQLVKMVADEWWWSMERLI